MLVDVLLKPFDQGMACYLAQIPRVVAVPFSRVRSQNIHYHGDRCCHFPGCFSPPPSFETSFS